MVLLQLKSSYDQADLDSESDDNKKSMHSAHDAPTGVDLASAPDLTCVEFPFHVSEAASAPGCTFSAENG